MIVVDSVERMRDAWVLDALDALVRAAAGPRRVVISGRSIPRLRELAVLRVHDDLIDIGDVELELDEREAEQLYELVCGDADRDASRAIRESDGGMGRGLLPRREGTARSCGASGRRMRRACDAGRP